MQPAARCVLTAAECRLQRVVFGLRDDPGVIRVLILQEGVKAGLLVPATRRPKGTTRWNHRCVGFCLPLAFGCFRLNSGPLVVVFGASANTECILSIRGDDGQ